jgi:signal peptidase I
VTGDVGRLVRITRNLALTVGAVLGAAVLVGLVAGAAFGVRPVVITSGSMEPAIGTGALALVQRVPASEVRVGDVVTVPTSTGSRVTHRVFAVDGGSPEAVLTLRGDANPTPDPQPYAVSSADRVFLDVPGVGYALGAMRTPAGLLVGGGVAAVLLLFAGRGGRAGGGGGPPGKGRHRAELRRTRATAGAGAAATLTVALVTVPSSAAWTDPVDVSGTAIAAHTVLRPASSSCTSAVVSATVSWPGDARYDYEVVLGRVSPDTVVSTRQVTGAATSTTYTGLTDFGLDTGAGTVDFQVEVTSYLAGTTAWRSASARTYSNIRVVAIGLGLTVSCTT